LTFFRMITTNQSVFGGHMADDLNEFDDPEQSYRRGYSRHQKTSKGSHESEGRNVTRTLLRLI
jgi:hypothetical protein